MLWVYGRFKYFYPYSVGIDFRRQNQTSTDDPRAVRVKTLNYTIEIVTHFMFLVTLTHNFEWLKFTKIYTIWIKTYPGMLF